MPASRMAPAMPSEHVDAWLAEDAATEDVTSRSVIPEETQAKARIQAKEAFVAAGLETTAEILEADGVEITLEAKDGDRVEAGDTLVTARGPARALLAAERTALNLLSHLSGIATRTASVVDAVQEQAPRCTVLATRKTTPGLRALEHTAVEAGGGAPHRGDLSQAVLIKENHLAFVTIEEAVEATRQHAPDAFCMVEAEDTDEARAVARAAADGVLLDNFDPDLLADTAELVRRIQPGIVVEASGGLTEETAPAYAEHVDRVSLGSITHSAPAVDVSMRVEPA